MTAVSLYRHALFFTAHRNSFRKTATARGSVATFDTKAMESLNWKDRKLSGLEAMAFR
jgi:hypothetical protein